MRRWSFGGGRRAGGRAVGGRLHGGERGQALLLVLGALLAVLAGAVMLGLFAEGVGAQSREQSAADLAALAGARAMRADYQRLFVPPRIDGHANPQHLERAGYLAAATGAATAVARVNGARRVLVSFPDALALAPVRIRVTVTDPVTVRAGGRRAQAAVRAVAEAELVPPTGVSVGPDPSPGDYGGPFAYRQGKPMRPDVALAFDRLDRAATAAGHPLIVVSAFRSSAEQAVLFAAHPDPRWVAPPGVSLHRLGTELDLGPPGAWAWLVANGERFHFVKRYAWEPWHFGMNLNAGSTHVGLGGERHGAMPSFVPARFAPMLARAAQRWNVSAALLAAQIYVESRFNPFAVSGAGAQGIAQFMPATAAAYGLRDPFDAARAIDAQAHLMRDLLRRFAAVPLALAAYNAGPGAVAGCGCVPPIPETQGYVAAILALLHGAGDLSGTGGLTVRLVR